MTTRGLLVGSMLALVGAYAAQQGVDRQSDGPLRPRVEIGSNVRVSDAGISHVEPYIAAHPTDAGSLVIVGSRDDGRVVVAEGFVTSDAGRTWTARRLPEVATFGLSVDNWVAFGADGVAYLSTLGSRIPGQTWGGILVYRSTDRGRSWEGPAVLPGNSYDRPSLATGGSAMAPRLFVSVLVRGSDRRVFQNPVEGDGVAVLVSVDSARSFTRLAFIAPDNLAHQGYVPAVLPDGSLLIPYVDYPVMTHDELAAMRRDPAQARFNAARLYVAPSPDGGRTFGLPRFISDVPRMFGGPAELAVDTSSGAFRGRVYAAWNGGTEDRRDVTVARSSDGGRHWTKAHMRAAGAGAAHFASLAVSRQGTVGVMWLQHEDSLERRECYRIYFAASADGGASFTEPVVVSDAVSCPTSEGNPRTLERWVRGTDYLGMAAGADGRFHPVWVDARTGVFEVYTAALRVAR